MEVTTRGKMYHGFRDASGICFIEVISNWDQKVGHPLTHEVHHSPTGFEWGYGGSGPADTARSILADHLGFVPPPSVYQQYKFAVVSVLDHDDWRLTSDDVALVLTDIKAHLGIECLKCGDHGFIGKDGDSLRQSKPCGCRAGLQYQRETGQTWDRQSF